jgi:hypothetical protein
MNRSARTGRTLLCSRVWLSERQLVVPTRRLERLVAPVALAAALGAVLSLPVAAARQTPSGLQDLNVSTGSPEASSNRAGVQARWKDRGRVAALFITGFVDLSSASIGHLRGDGSLVLLEETGQTLQVYEWQSQVGGTLPDVARRALAVGADQLTRVSLMAPPLPQANTSSTPTPTSTGDYEKTLPGATLQGLPAVSDDPTAAVVQAGWRSGDERLGLAARGRWRVVHGGVSTGDSPAWFVVFAVDLRTGDTRRLQITPDVHDGFMTRGFANGQEVPIDAAARQWAAETLRAFQRIAPDFARE